MKPIKPSFNLGGFHYRLLKRSGDIAIFEQSKPHWTSPAYEVVVIQKRAERVFNGIVFPAREAMPSSESCGTYGWTYNTLEDAQRRFDSLCTDKNIPASVLAMLEDEPNT